MGGGPVIDIRDLIPDIKPGTRGLCHVGPKETKRLTFFARKALYTRLEEKAEAAGVVLTAGIRNRMLVIGWAPK
jgi:hypothetical protein